MNEISTFTFGTEYAEPVSVINDGASILVRNYRVRLTAYEHMIVALLIRSGNWVLKSDIAAEMSCEKAVNPSVISVHVANINKKVSAVTGRKLIEGNRESEYRIIPGA